MKSKFLQTVLEEVDFLFLNGKFFDALIILKKYKFFFLWNKLKKLFFYYYGALCSLIGQYKRAVFFLKKALLLVEYNLRVEIYYYLIHALLKLHFFEKAIFYFKKMLEYPDKPFFIFLAYYEIITKKIELDIKLELLESILPEKCNNINDELTFVVNYMIKRKFESAYKILQKNYPAYCNYYFFNLLYLKTMYKLNNYEQIIDYFIKNTDYLNGIEILIIYAASLYKLKFYDESRIVLENILKLDHFNILAKINIAKILIIKKRELKALSILYPLTKIASRYYSYYKDSILFYIALVYQRIGLLNDFLKIVKRIDDESKEFSKCMFNLSLTYYDLGHIDEAKKCFKKVNKDFIPEEKYLKWSKNIEEKVVEKKFYLLNYFVSSLPFLIIIFSFIIVIVLYILFK